MPNAFWGVKTEARTGSEINECMQILDPLAQVSVKLLALDMLNIGTVCRAVIHGDGGTDGRREGAGRNDGMDDRKENRPRETGDGSLRL